MRALLMLVIALLLFNHFGKWMEKLGLGRLPGDIRFRFLGRNIFLPLTSSIVLSMVATLVMLIF